MAASLGFGCRAEPCTASPPVQRKNTQLPVWPPQEPVSAHQSTRWETRGRPPRARSWMSPQPASLVSRQWPPWPCFHVPIAADSLSVPTGTVLATRRTRISFRPPCRLPLPAERRLLVGEQAPRRPRSKPGIKAVPQSGLLGRLQAFLPTLEAANADLQAQPAEEVAMEHGRCAAGAAAALSAFPAALVVVAEITAPACRPAGCPHSRSGLVSSRQPQLAC
jgi:hypothetical protein